MKKFHILLIAGFAVLLFSCSKDKSAEKDNTNPASKENFQPVSSGSQWHYKDGTGLNGGFTLTATGKDSTIQGRTFSIFNSKPDTSTTVVQAFFAKDNNDYYVQSVFKAMGNDPVLYLKDSVTVQSIWSQNITVNQPPFGEMDCIITFTLAQTNATQQVNGVTFKNTSTVNFNIKSIQGSFPLGNGTMLVSRGVGILSIQVSSGASTVANYVLDSYSIK